MTAPNTCSQLLASYPEAWADRFSAVPAARLPAVGTYIEEVGAIPDVFDGLDAGALQELARELPADGGGQTGVDRFVRAHLGYLSTWFTALDSLDAGLRDDAGLLPDWAEPIVRGIALDLFEADQALKAAVIEYHHGSAGLRLEPGYGHQFPLSNGTADPFAR